MTQKKRNIAALKIYAKLVFERENVLMSKFFPMVTAHFNFVCLDFCVSLQFIGGKHL